MTDPTERWPVRPMPPGPEEHALAWKAIFARRAVVGFVALALLLILVSTLVTVVLIRGYQSDGRATVNQIKNCTTPGRACYERGQRQTARAVGDINRVTVYAVTCATEEPGRSVTEVTRCVTRLLAQDKPKARRP